MFKLTTSQKTTLQKATFQLITFQSMISQLTTFQMSQQFQVLNLDKFQVETQQQMLPTLVLTILTFNFRFLLLFKTLSFFT